MTKIETREQYEWALGRIEALVNDVTEDMPDNDSKKIEYCILSDLVADRRIGHKSIPNKCHPFRKMQSDI